MASFNVQLFLIHMLQLHIYMAWFLLYPFPIPPAPLAVPLLLPFVSPSTYLAPSSCDRNRPPSSQVVCKLTLFAPPFTQLFHPSQLPRNPTAQRLQRRHWDHSALTMRNTPFPRSAVVVWTGRPRRALPQPHSRLGFQGCRADL
jgi:hypothetical protein